MTTKSAFATKNRARSSDGLSASTSPQSTEAGLLLQPKSDPCVEALDARRRFLAEHGPDAELRHRASSTKELRRALRAAEMARWECFSSENAADAAWL